MSDVILTKESRELGYHTMDVIHRVMEIGRKERCHPPYSWRDNVSVDEHMVKVLGHLNKYVRRAIDNEDHLNHALCRLAMAIYIRDMITEVASDEAKV